MYIFGGVDSQGNILGNLTVLKLLSGNSHIIKPYIIGPISPTSQSSLSTNSEHKSSNFISLLHNPLVVALGVSIAAALTLALISLIIGVVLHHNRTSHHYRLLTIVVEHFHP